MSQKYTEMLNELESSLKANKSDNTEANWMIKIKVGKKAVTKSTMVAGATKMAYNEYAPVLDHQFVITRGFMKDSASLSVLPDGGLTAHELKIVVPISAITADLHNAFSQNVLVPDMHLIRLSTVSGAPVTATTAIAQKTAEYEFTSAYISGLMSRNDLLCIAFRYSTMAYKMTEFIYNTGAAQGAKVAAYHNFATGTGYASKPIANT